MVSFAKGLPYSSEKQTRTTRVNDTESHNCTTQWDNYFPKKYMEYDSIYVKFKSMCTVIMLTELFRDIDICGKV